jgi:hypothetical protein
MNYDIADDGSVDNRKKRGQKQKKKLLTNGKKRSMKEIIQPS